MYFFVYFSSVSFGKVEISLLIETTASSGDSGRHFKVTCSETSAAGYLEMRCSKSCYLCDLELVDLFDNKVIEQVDIKT